MRYTVIGDIHGRRVWEDLVDPSTVNIFVGDYFDPYDPIPFEALKENFLEIIKFAKTYPDTILLMGNHDLHYIHRDDHSRMNVEHYREILQLFLDNISLFDGIAVAIDKDTLISHAGVTDDWLATTGFTKKEYNAYDLADWCNQLFWDGYEEHTRNDEVVENGWFSPKLSQMRHFMFSNKAGWGDRAGTTSTQSPVWVRPQTLINHNALPNGVQIVGHTQMNRLAPEISLEDNIIIVDCLGQEPAVLIIDTENKQKYKVRRI